MAVKIPVSVGGVVVVVVAIWPVAVAEDVAPGHALLAEYQTSFTMKPWPARMLLTESCGHEAPMFRR